MQSSPYSNFGENLRDVLVLRSLSNQASSWTRKSGSFYGSKEYVRVLNNTSIVLLVAAWQVFIEDLVSWAFTMLSGKGRVSQRVVDSKIVGFNTPNQQKVDELVERKLGIQNLSANWHWSGVSTAAAKKKLQSLINHRNGIAHKLTKEVRMTNSGIDDYIHFISILVVISNNRVRSSLRQADIGTFPGEAGYRRGQAKRFIR